MPTLKCQLHIHVKGDPLDPILYDIKKLINEASSLKFNVIAITCHRKVIFNKKLAAYARRKGILLISGIELEIKGKHILALNIDKSIEKVDSFKKLQEFRQNHKSCFIIAPHPFFPGKTSLGKDLIENIQLFDAIENSFCYTKTRNYNLPAISLAKRWKKPLIACGDCHLLKQLNLGFCLVKSQKNCKSLFQALKNHQFQNSTKPLTWAKLFRILIPMMGGYYFRKIFAILKFRTPEKR